MISGYETKELLPPERGGKFQWGAAIGAGFIAGVIFLLFPRGSPWSLTNFFSPVVMGRIVPPNWGIPLILVWLMHLGVSILYALIISVIVAHLHRERAILTGGLVGLVLYFLNLGMVSLVWPQLRTLEALVVFTHIVFGLIAAGAYRGLLKRRVVVEKAG